MLLFFDTETTGKADFRAPAEAPQQPELVQLGAVLVDDARRVVATVGKIVKPQDWEIPAQAEAIHGISTDLAQRVGWDRQPVLMDFKAMAEMADGMVGHNVSFDLMVMRTAFYREREAAGCPDKPSFCTMKASTDVLQLPGPYGYKWPRLTEAYQYFTGKELSGAHDALVDVYATMEVFWALKDMGLTKRTHQND